MAEWAEDLAGRSKQIKGRFLPAFLLFQENIMENTTQLKKEKHSGASKFLNRYFHQIDRGSNLRTEVLTGIIVFFVTICLLFVNMQLIGKSILGDLTVSSSPQDAASIEACKTYVSIYQGSLLVSLISSLLIGLVARLPFVQLSLMGFSSTFIGFLCANSGLTYQNLLFLSFISSVLFAILSGIPFLRKKIRKAIPKPILHVLPMISGAILVWMGISLSGFFDMNEFATGSLGKQVSFVLPSLKTLTGIPLLAFISVLVGLVSYLILRANRSKHPFSFSFLVTFCLFLLLSVIGLISNNFSTTKSDSYINFGRIWLIMGSQSSPTTPFGDSYLTYAFTGLGDLFKNISTVFTKGMDFSAYSGNSILLIVSSVLSAVLFQFVDPMIVLECSKEDRNIQEEESEEKEIQKLYWINSGMNVIAPLLGAGTVTVSKSSLLATKDKAKSGIVPLVSSIGYLISLFILAFPAILATDTHIINSMNEFNYFAYGNGGLIYLIQGASFGIADAFVALIGLLMIEKSIQLLKEDKKEELPVIALFVIGIFVKGIALAFTLSLAYILLVQLFVYEEKDENKNFFVRAFLGFKNNIKSIQIPTLCLFAYSLLACCL